MVKKYLGGVLSAVGMCAFTFIALLIALFAGPRAYLQFTNGMFGAFLKKTDGL